MTGTTTIATAAPSPRRRSLAGSDLRFALLTALGLAIFPLVLHPFGGYATLSTQILMVAVATTGFNLLLGYAGTLSYGHAMFYGGGGYVAAIFLTKLFPHTPNMWLALGTAVLVTTLLSLAVGAVTVRLYGIYFALLTLAFAQMVYFIVEQAKNWTNGDDGIQSVPNALVPVGPWSIDLTRPLPAADLGVFGNLSEIRLWYVFSALILLAVLLFMRALTRSQFGEVLDAIRENENRSIFVGYNAAAYRLCAFAISGALAGLSGALRALYDGSASVDTLGVDRSGSFVIYTIVGGVQTIFGPVLGTGLIMYLENVLSARTPTWRLIEGLIFVGVIVFMPGGILGTILKRRKAAAQRAALAASVSAR